MLGNAMAALTDENADLCKRIKTEDQRVDALQKEVFADPKQVVWYVLATSVLGAHLLYGWQKTVRKPQGLGKYLPKDAQPAAEAIGNAMAYFVTLGFVACPLYTFYLVRSAA